MLSNGGTATIVSIGDLSRDAYEARVEVAMDRLLGGTDPGKVVAELSRDPEVGEEFALVAMEDAAARIFNAHAQPGVH